MTDKKARVMTPKGFLHKASGKVSAEAFLSQYREWLTTGDLAQFTSPILAKLDSKELLPTPCLETIKSVVLGHMLAQDLRKGEEALAKAQEGSISPTGEVKAPRIPKTYLVTIYDSSGNVCQRLTDKGETKDLSQSFDNGSEAHGWADRRLFEGASDWYAIVQNVKMLDKEGDPFSSIIMRDDAIARILRGKKGPAMHDTSKKSSKLSWGMKCTQSHCHFSKG